MSPATSTPDPPPPPDLGPPPDLPLALPPGWVHGTRPEAGILLAASPREPGPSGVRPGINLVAEPVDGCLEDWVELTLRDLGPGLDRFDLEDEDDYDDGCPVAYRRFSYAHEGHHLLCDLWAWVVDGIGLMLTGTVVRGEYLDYCDLFEDVARGCDPEAVVRALHAGPTRPTARAS